MGGCRTSAAAAPEDFTYYMDFTDQLPPIGTTQRYYLTTQDSGTGDGDTTIVAYELCYVIDGVPYVVASASGLPTAGCVLPVQTYKTSYAVS